MNELKSILNKKKPLSFYLKSAWYFDKPYEKAILVGLGILGLWKIAGWVF